ncbi:MAG: hypothetical protein B6D56_03770 [Candidatus Omnitrophica bacterium 4484_70.1]|nr:MAG: hypothetical protein B6D56_03770 [Candidatus Omnitrophica bacterium 4484_70.1]
MKEKLLRVIDVNFNRCKEGLRVVEDIFRFIVEDEKLRKNVRKVRHNLDELVQGEEFWQQLVRSRDSQNDSGKEIDKWEEKRENLFVLLYANLQRAKESIRVLEEFLKIIDSKKVKIVKSLRYELYSLEKEALSRGAALCNSR